MNEISNRGVSGPPEQEWALNDPYSVRWRELEAGLKGKVYPASDEELAAFRAKVEALVVVDDNGLAILRQSFLESQEALQAYYNIRRWHEEIRTALHTEGLTPINLE